MNLYKRIQQIHWIAKHIEFPTSTINYDSKARHECGGPRPTINIERREMPNIIEICLSKSSVLKVNLLKWLPYLKRFNKLTSLLLTFATMSKMRRNWWWILDRFNPQPSQIQSRRRISWFPGLSPTAAESSRKTSGGSVTLYGPWRLPHSCI